ncbi:ribosomal protein L21 [Chloropicon roscoffensis]|uniref:Large ribosomal subunit protein bL21m n=1 Tax=Chloropicon roscoffensis TaxID=1461544 RepID=A0AAX4PJ15_9CHLO
MMRAKLTGKSGMAAVAPARARQATARAAVHALCPARAVSARRPERSVRSYSAAQAEVPPLEEGSVAYEKQDYAVVELGGSQVIVEVGGVYDTNRLDAEPGSTIKLNRVLLVKNQESNDLRLGKPYVENATVEAEIVQHKKAKKVVVFKMQPKKHTRSKVGHRQHQTTIKVTKISV